VISSGKVESKILKEIELWKRRKRSPFVLLIFFSFHVRAVFVVFDRDAINILLLHFEEPREKWKRKRFLQPCFSKSILP